MSRPLLFACRAYLGLLALLAACGGDGDAAPAASAASPTGAPPSGEPAVAQTATPPPAEPTATTGVLRRDELGVIDFVRADGVIVSLPVEAPPRDEYSIGLSGRYSLDERGMLFTYPGEETRRGFWMKNTHIDLAIAFVSAQFRIVEIHELVAESLEIVRPMALHRYAVEAPAGWYAQHGVQVGDRMRLRFALPDGDGGGD